MIKSALLWSTSQYLTSLTPMAQMTHTHLRCQPGTVMKHWLINTRYKSFLYFFMNNSIAKYETASSYRYIYKM